MAPAFAEPGSKIQPGQWSLGGWRPYMLLLPHWLPPGYLGWISVHSIVGNVWHLVIKLLAGPIALLQQMEASSPGLEFELSGWLACGLAMCAGAAEIWLSNLERFSKEETDQAWIRARDEYVRSLVYITQNQVSC